MHKREKHSTRNKKREIKIVLLSSCDSSTTIHLLYYLQTKRIKVDHIIFQSEEKKCKTLEDYSKINSFNLYFVDNASGQKCRNMFYLPFYM